MAIEKISGKMLAKPIPTISIAENAATVEFAAKSIMFPVIDTSSVMIRNRLGDIQLRMIEPKKRPNVKAIKKSRVPSNPNFFIS